MSWNMVTDSKPEDSFDVIVCRDNVVGVGNYVPILDRWICLDPHGSGWFIAHDVTAWMELPAPPEEAYEGK